MRSLPVADLLFSFLIFNDRAPWTRIVSLFHIQTIVEGEAFKVLCSVPGPKDIQNFKDFGFWPRDTWLKGSTVELANKRGRTCAILCLSAEQQTDKRADPWECYAEYAMFNAIRISRKLGGNTSTFTFVFKMIFISSCICYSTFLPGIICFFL